MVAEVHAVGRAVGPSDTQFYGGLQAVPHVERRIHIDTGVALPERHKQRLGKVKADSQVGELGVAGIDAPQGVASQLLHGSRAVAADVLLDDFLVGALGGRLHLVGLGLDRGHVTLVGLLREAVKGKQDEESHQEDRALDAMAVCSGNGHWLKSVKWIFRAGVGELVTMSTSVTTESMPWWVVLTRRRSKLNIAPHSAEWK